MKLYELMELVYLKEGNIKVDLTIASSDIAHRYGGIYDGKVHPLGGINGRVNDVPCYLATCDVKSYELSYTPYELAVTI